MFEDSLMESGGKLKTKSKYWSIVTFGVNGVILAGLIIWPLLHPEALPFRLEAPKVVMPLMPKPPVPVAQAQRESSAPSANMATMSVTRPLIATLLPDRDAAANDAPPLAPFGNRMGMPDGLPTGIGDGHGPSVTVAPVKAPARINVSTGVLQGMLLAPIRPVYPAIARAAHVEGTVIVEAVISRQGTIESLHVVSGPAMLQNAALDAIRAARYQPYRLNGEPTEVQTTITVNFRMNG